MIRQILAKYLIDYETVLDEILAVANAPHGTKLIKCDKNDMKNIINAGCEVILNQPNMLELNAPINIIGDMHGHFFDLIRIFNKCGWPNEKTYLFLGNYTNFGRYGIETVLLILVMKLKFPENVFMLRGNHDCDKLTELHGFKQECKHRYGSKIWKLFINLFNNLPPAAIVGDSIFCAHGGICENILKVGEIHQIPRGMNVPVQGPLTDLLWSDPNTNEEETEFSENIRGISRSFPKFGLETFLKNNKLYMMVRSNQLVPEGFEIMWGGILVNLFSAANFGNDYNNKGAIMEINDELQYNFIQFEAFGIDPRWEEAEQRDLDKKISDEKQKKDEEERIRKGKRSSSKRTRLNRVAEIRNQMKKDAHDQEERSQIKEELAAASSKNTLSKNRTSMVGTGKSIRSVSKNKGSSRKEKEISEDQRYSFF
jgi:serine/threonine-protein phosphatase PP1 catalytic subunit